MCTVDIVVARYREDVGWLLALVDYPGVRRVIIYDKGGDRFPGGIPPPLSRCVVRLENEPMGREGHTYLRHIVEHLHPAEGGLADVTVFCQGDPFAHSPDFVDLVRYTVDRAVGANVQPLTYRFLESTWMGCAIPPLQTRLDDRTACVVDLRRGRSLRVYVAYASRERLHEGGFTDIGRDENIATFRAHYGLPDGVSTVDHVCANVMGVRPPAHADETPFAYAGCFAVSRARIEGHPAAAYARLRDWVCEHRCNGYMLERLWLTLFGPYHAPADPYRAGTVFFVAATGGDGAVVERWRRVACATHVVVDHGAGPMVSGDHGFARVLRVPAGATGAGLALALAQYILRTAWLGMDVSIRPRLVVVPVGAAIDLPPATSPGNACAVARWLMTSPALGCDGRARVLA